MSCVCRANRPAFLTHPPLQGFDKTCKVLYRANEFYLTPTSDYYEARVATVQAAADLYGEGGPEVQAIQAAWDTVSAPRKPYPEVGAPQCEPQFATKPSTC